MLRYFRSDPTLDHIEYQGHFVKNNSKQSWTEKMKNV